MENRAGTTLEDEFDGPALQEEDPVEVEAAERSFERFFTPLADSDTTMTRLNQARNREQTSLRFELDLAALREYDAELAKKLLNRPLAYYRAALTGLRRALENRFKVEEINGFETFLAVEGSFGPALVTPRGLKANFLSKMVCVEGIVTKLGMVKPKLVKLVQYCRDTDKYRPELSFNDGTALDGSAPTPLVIPTVDDFKNPLEVEFGESKYRDYQKFTIQEMPERAPLGQLPRSIEVICEDDLVDLVKPGDRVACTGIYRAMNVRSVAELTGMFRTALICNSVKKLGRDIGGITLNPNELEAIREVAQESDAFERLARSLAPSIYGHEYVKKAILLLLLGGVEKILDNGTHLRGDINILIVGDPSTAKSQMLRFVLGIAPLAISTTGRGSTGVGLTAAVTTDPDTGERRLEAGAMVLADRGVVLIDEFDKMGDGDRVAIHEVMEQQTVTIAKAGIHASLNARCSVVAAANPIYGQYNKDLSPQRNIGLPDSLLSRFDLLFVVLDNSSADSDRAVADHVLRIHRYQEPGKEGKPVPLNEPTYAFLNDQKDSAQDDEEEDEFGMKKFSIYEKFNPVLHPAFARTQPLFSIDFMRKFIFAAKNLNRSPKLTEEARQIISDEYASLRSEQATKTLPITPRCLETIIRLSTAHAKLRFSNQIEPQDVEVAKEVLRFALYNDTEKAEERRKQKEMNETRKRVMADAGDGDEEEEDIHASSGDDEEEENQPEIIPREKRSRIEQPPEEEPVDPSFKPNRDDRFAFFRDALREFFPADSEGKSIVSCMEFANKIMKEVHAGTRVDTRVDRRWRAFPRAEVDEYLRVLDTENRVMLREEKIFFVGS